MHRLSGWTLPAETQQLGVIHFRIAHVIGIHHPNVHGEHVALPPESVLAPRREARDHASCRSELDLVLVVTDARDAGEHLVHPRHLQT